MSERPGGTFAWIGLAMIVVLFGFLLIFMGMAIWFLTTPAGLILLAAVAATIGVAMLRAWWKGRKHP